MGILERIAAEIGKPTRQVASLLSRHAIDLSVGTTIQSHRLRITRVAFTGVKDHTDESGFFEFQGKFDQPCMAVASDKNLTGKTSVISIAKWALRGSPDSDLSAVVRSWLHNVEVDGLIDALPFKIRFDPRSSSGELSVGTDDASTTTEFEGQSEFSETMKSFFESGLGLPQIPGFQNNQMGGSKVAHGWLAYLGAVWISDSHEELLLGETTYGALPQRLLNMFVAVPFAETSYALGQATSSLEARAKALRADPNASAKTARREQINAELKELRERVARNPDPVTSSQGIQAATEEWRRSDRLVSEAEQNLRDLREDYKAAAGELRRIEREAAAGRVLAALEPSRCPRCSTPVSPDDRSAEDIDNCYVCSHPEPSLLESGDDPTDQLSTEVERLQATITRLEPEVEQLILRRDASQGALSAAQTSLSSTTNGMSDRVAIARLEGELAGIDLDLVDQDSADSVDEDLKDLKAARRVVEANRKQEAFERFARIDASLLRLLERLGFRDVESVHLTPQAGLEITYTNGTTAAFKTLQDGEKVRARLATVISMLGLGDGRHPGLIVYDSLGNKEVNSQDLSSLLKALQDLAKTDGIQVIVTHQRHSIAVESLGEDSVIGPQSGAGHIF